MNRLVFILEYHKLGYRRPIVFRVNHDPRSFAHKIVRKGEWTKDKQSAEREGRRLLLEVR